jgi:hypothetical protein
MKMSVSNIIEAGPPQSIHMPVDSLGFFTGHVEKGMLGDGGHLAAFRGHNCPLDFAMVGESNFLSPVEGL